MAPDVNADGEVNGDGDADVRCVLCVLCVRNRSRIRTPSRKTA